MTTIKPETSTSLTSTTASQPVAFTHDLTAQTVQVSASEYKRYGKFIPLPKTCLYHQPSNVYIIPVLGLADSKYAQQYSSSDVVINPMSTTFSVDEYEFIDNPTGKSWDVFTLALACINNASQSIIPLPMLDDNEVSLNTSAMYVQKPKSAQVLCSGFVTVNDFGTKVVEDANGRREVSVVELMVCPINGTSRCIIIEASKIAVRKLGDILRDCGLVVLNEKSLISFLSCQLIELRETQGAYGLGFITIDRLGWTKLASGDYIYNRGDKILRSQNSKVSASALRPSNKCMPQLHVRGTHQQWLDNIFIYAKNKPLVLGLMLKTLCSVLFEFTSIMPITLCVWGTTQHGKSLMGHIFASTKSNGSKKINDLGVPSYIRDLDGSDTGLKAALKTQNGLTGLYDELSVATNLEIKKLIYNVGNGAGRQIANPDSTVKTINPSQNMLMVFSEESMKDLVLHSKGQTNAGVLNRLFEIHVKQPIFPEGADDLWCNQLKENCGLYYGTTFEMLTQSLLNDNVNPQMVHELFVEALARIKQDNPSLQTLPSKEDRILDVITLAEVVGRLTVKYGILPVSDDVISQSIDYLVSCMVNSNHQAIGSVLDYLKHAVDNKLVSSVIRKDHKSLVFFHTIKDGAHHEHYLAFDAKRFDEHFSKSVSVTLRKELKAKGRMAAGRYERYLGDCNLKVFLIKYDSFMRSMFPNPDFIAHFDKKDEAIAKTGCCESLRTAPSAQKAKVVDLSDILGEDD